MKKILIIFYIDFIKIYDMFIRSDLQRLFLAVMFFFFTTAINQNEKKNICFVTVAYTFYKLT